MRRATAVLLTGYMLIAPLAYAGNGDLIVDGNLGVGTANPGSKLEVLGTSNSRITENVPSGTNGLYSDILLRGTFSNYPTDVFTRNVGLIRAGFSTGVWGTGYLSFGVAGRDCITDGNTDPCTRVIITNNGNVGIGTTSPVYPLQVQKTSSGPAIMIGGGYPGQPRLQIYGLDADANAWMGLGADMGGGPYEHSIYYSLGSSNNGKLTFGTFDGSSYSEKMRITATGNVGIGTASPTYLLQVNGSFAATSKNFDIKDPRYNNEKRRLAHSTLEGPEIGVYYRGEAKLHDGIAVVTLPPYFEALTRPVNRTVLLTAKFDSNDVNLCSVAASAVSEGKFIIKAYGVPDSSSCNHGIYWEVKAERSDIEKLKVEQTRD